MFEWANFCKGTQGVLEACVEATKKGGIVIIGKLSQGLEVDRGSPGQLLFGPQNDIGPNYSICAGLGFRLQRTLRSWISGEGR